jgi:threonine dehydratase
VTVSNLGPEQIAATEPLIRPYIRRTPVLEVNGADFGLPGATLLFKLELTQQSGSFKARGAYANLLLRPVPRAGVVAASGGNHGAAVAHAARSLNIKARIYVPRISTQAKVDRIRASGAELFLVGERYADALAASEEWAASSGALQIHAFDQDETMLGAGTLGLELEQQAGALDAVLVSVGGGGLIGGVASWFAGRVSVIGVEPDLAPTLTLALEAGRPVDAPAGGIAADSLAPRRVGERVFPIAQRHVKEVILVPDEAIAQAQEALWSTLRIAAEPGRRRRLRSRPLRPLQGAPRRPHRRRHQRRKHLGRQLPLRKPLSNETNADFLFISTTERTERTEVLQHQLGAVLFWVSLPRA